MQPQTALGLTISGCLSLRTPRSNAFKNYFCSTTVVRRRRSSHEKHKFWPRYAGLRVCYTSSRTWVGDPALFACCTWRRTGYWGGQMAICRVLRVPTIVGCGVAEKTKIKLLVFFVLRRWIYEGVVNCPYLFVYLCILCAKTVLTRVKIGVNMLQHTGVCTHYIYWGVRFETFVRILCYEYNRL